MSKAINKIPKRGEIQSSERKSIPYRGEIWLIDYNYKPKKGKEKELEIASKIKKIRPSLIVSNNPQNEFDIEIIVAPLSSKKLERIEPYEILIKKNEENGLDEDSKILFNRLRAIEKEDRLGDYIGVLDQEFMKEVKKKLKLAEGLKSRKIRLNALNLKTQFTKKYSGLNNLERRTATELDNLVEIDDWCRNPTHYGYGIELIDEVGLTQTFSGFSVLSGGDSSLFRSDWRVFRKR
ncbi:140_t:CDS:2 [Ambispora leptoticha]|uniref:140_t:CDS:1 n=1 Tax=Ambispora leptoticha TaxID=144679 RepID=A0A9N9FKI5_9GLOM|nr:140_t:CDS:2 [Ambispora leptoticha]